MNCSEAKSQIVFYVYGEISSEVEELVESHLAVCENCRAELARHRLFLGAVEQRDERDSEGLVTSCRARLRSRLAEESQGSWSWRQSIRDFSRLNIPFRIPVGAMALVLIGWVGARHTPERFFGAQAGLDAPMYSSVRSVQPDGSGRIQIAVDDVKRHMVVGDLHDPQIRSLLLSAVRDEANPGVRVESLGALQSSADSDEVRRALIDAVTRDPNAGVRLKALEGLKQYGGDATVRKTLANVLLTDDDPGIRGQAIDMLTAHHDDSIVGVLQDAVQKEDNTYIRTRCRNLLEAMNASVGTY